MTHRGPFQPRTFCGSVILLLTHPSPSARTSAGNRLQALEGFSDLERSIILKKSMSSHFGCKDSLENAD